MSADEILQLLFDPCPACATLREALRKVENLYAVSSNGVVMQYEDSLQEILQCEHCSDRGWTPTPVLKEVLSRLKTLAEKPTEEIPW